MAIDNRKVLQNIQVPVTEENPVRRMLTETEADEITAIFNQEQLDRLTADGVLAGDWKSTKTGAKTATDKKGK